METTDTLIGYVVLGGSPSCLPTRMVADMSATSIAAVRRRPDGSVYVAAGGGSTGEIGTGYAGLGLNGSSAVDFGSIRLNIRVHILTWIGRDER